ncbi:Activating transcription factor 7-interacting protein 1 [Collichthys lucidus]|uniref:Activating transcription factor 7-interacting protein 1 n=1 Tax=Collichthys lucidus TaxID=240159 RepID=A0A4U5U1Z3_COLLU|nr:Activating transcription factor 7-interacting protein 1 [Collichthys lucidus]
MEVVMTEEKKKIFRARKTMKLSDRGQLESLHGTLLTATPGLSESPPLMNGTHKEDGQKGGDKEQNNSDSNSPRTTGETRHGCEGVSDFTEPMDTDNDTVKATDPEASTAKTKDEKPPSSKSTASDSSLPRPSSSSHPASSSCADVKQEKETKEEVKEQEDDKEDVKKGSKSEAKMEVDSVKVQTKKEKTEVRQTTKPSRPASTPPSNTGTREWTLCRVACDIHSITRLGQEPKSPIAHVGLVPPCLVNAHGFVKKATQASLDLILKCEKLTVPKSTHLTERSVKYKRKKKTYKSALPVLPGLRLTYNRRQKALVQEDKGSTSGLKRTLSEGYEKDERPIKREVKRPKVERGELEAQLELKITAKAGSHHKLEKIVQQLVDERLRALQLTIFDKHFEELKERVDKIDCATKHQTAINTLQAKIARLAKKFGEANQASENKRKQEALAAAAAAATAAAAAAKTAAVSNSPQVPRLVFCTCKANPVRVQVLIKTAPLLPNSVLRRQATLNSAPSPPTWRKCCTTTNCRVLLTAPVRTSMEVKQTPTTVPSSGTAELLVLVFQSPTGTLLLKTAPGSSMMATGQPLLIQLPLSMANGQPGTLVNIPVSSLSAANTLNKSKTTTPTATFILKPAPAITTAPVSAASTVPALQASTGQMSTQISLARAVYQGGAGAITTPNAGVSVTTARTPAQSVSVAGAMSSASSPATSGPAATGSTAPGPPQGTSLTSKTDNQAASSTPSKAAAPGARPKGSVIDLTEDDDDVQVTGVKNATVAPNARPIPVISIPNSKTHYITLHYIHYMRLTTFCAGARSSPQINQTSPNNPQLTVHHRPQQDSSLKARTVTTSSTPTRATNMALPPLPAAPAPPRLPPEAERSSPPQQPQLKLVPSQTGIVLSWCVAETDRTCAAVDSYHLYAFHQDNSNSSAAQQHWKKIGEVKALPLPMACTLTQFQSGSTYHFAVRAKDIYGRFGSFCEPQCTNVINSSSS